MAEVLPCFAAAMAGQPWALQAPGSLAFSSTWNFNSAAKTSVFFSRKNHHVGARVSSQSLAGFGVQSWGAGSIDRRGEDGELPVCYEGGEFWLGAKERRFGGVIGRSMGVGKTVLKAASASASTEAPAERAADVVLKFYKAINERDIERALTFIDDDCLYEDMIYTKPFVGKKAVKEHFQSVLEIFPEGMNFVVDNITDGDAMGLGMTWHVELEGKPFPFSRGCSFYRCGVKEGCLRIVYARDIPEPASKPGASALIILKYVARLFKQFPQLLDRMQ